MLRSYLAKPDYRPLALNVLAAPGEAAKDELPSWIAMLTQASQEDAAALAIGSLGLPIPKEAVPSLKKALQRPRPSDDPALKTAATLSLFISQEIRTQDLTEILHNHLLQNPTQVPDASYRKRIQIVK